MTTDVSSGDTPAIESAPPVLIEVPQIGVPQEPVAPEPSPEPVTFAPTGSPGLDLGLDFIGRVGIGMDTPEMQEASKGNFAPVTALLKSMGERATGYEKVLAVVTAAYQEQQVVAQERAKKDLDGIHGAVGGKDVWDAVSKWAGTEATEQEKVHVNTALAAGGFLAAIVAKGLSDMYSKATGGSETQDTVLAVGAVGKTQDFGSLSLTDYTKSVEKLYKELGDGMEKSPQYRALRARLKP
jgi:hypothetical protein